MQLFTASLNSGSNGNCYYIGNDTEAVLVDAGLSCRETERRMKDLGLDLSRVKAIFISHEHGDHIKGVEGLVAKHRLPVYITPRTLQFSRLRIPAELVQGFGAYETTSIGGLSIIPFPKKHDAIDPHSFVVSGHGVNIGVFTDIGLPCEHVINNFKQCHAIFLEANYDDHMLETGKYPIHLKRRISGEFGHLSNRQALELFMAHRPAHMKHVYLSHLSRENNHPDAALQFFAGFSQDINITVASRDEASGVFAISTTTDKKIAVQHVQPTKARQATLFDF